jgi:molybdopterin synthase sulfur carrier subunit
LGVMARLRLFAALREAAGVSSEEIEAATVGELLEEARRRYGKRFAEALEFASVAVNGEDVARVGGLDAPIEPEDEVALLPPVSGGGDPVPPVRADGRLR